MNQTSRCWCGICDLVTFSPQYLKCPACDTLVLAQMPGPEISEVIDEERDFYGRKYWFSQMERELGLPNIIARSRTDLPERCLYWLRTVLKFKLPPARILELGSAHGGFVAMLHQAGFDATGLEVSSWVVEFAHKTFNVPMLLGKVESQQIEPGSLDAIALMDVLEHLPDPFGTMRHCLSLLRPDGVLVIQTPRYPEGKCFEDMVAEGNPFLEQFKEKGHLYLFSQRSICEFFRRLGVEHPHFEPAIFSYYDMFLLASRMPLTIHSPVAIEEALSATPEGRVIQALLDLDDQIHKTKQILANSEADRAARLEVIQRQGAQIAWFKGEQGHWLKTAAELEQRVHKLQQDLALAEADRAARLEMIQRQGAYMDKLQQDLAFVEADRARLQSQSERLLFALHAIRTGRLYRLLRRMGRWAWLEQVVSESTPSSVPKTTSSSGSSINVPEISGPDKSDPSPSIRERKHLGGVVYTGKVVDRIMRELESAGFGVLEFVIDVTDYRAYFERAGYGQHYPGYYPSHLHEKSLEHYIAAKLLSLEPGDIYIDVASQGSPAPEIYSRLFACTSYRQDLTCPPGLNGNTIGGNPSDMPVPDGFANKMALHCSFEHFEGDADTRFIREAGRVLRPGGAVCIVPFYLFDQYVIQTDPNISIPANVRFDPDATVYCHLGWNSRHGRFYDVAHLASRVRRHLQDLTLTIYRIPNAKQVHESCYVEFAAILGKPGGLDRGSSRILERKMGSANSQRYLQ